MTLFSLKTQQFLSEYGWFPEHRVDLSDAITKLSKEGFAIFAAALVVLQRLQGLQTRTPTGHPWILAPPSAWEPMTILNRGCAHIVCASTHLVTGRRTRCISMSKRDYTSPTLRISRGSAKPSRMALMP